jgi:hypothetical protein
MEPKDLVDESDEVPSIKGHRLDIIDVLAALESSDPKSQIIDTWGFTPEEKEVLENYIEDNRDQIIRIMEKKTPRA